MAYKIIIISCCLISLMVYSCSSSKQQEDQKIMPFEDQFAKVSVEKIDDISFKSINYRWDYISSGHSDSIKTLLYEVYPNPFSPSPRLADSYSWFVIQPDSFELSLLDVNGNTIGTLFKNYLLEGSYLMKFVELHINSGEYFILMTVGKESFVRRFIYVR